MARLFCVLVVILSLILIKKKNAKFNLFDHENLLYLDEANVYTIRINTVSRLAPELLQSVEELGFSKIKWGRLTEKAGSGIERLIVFQTGTMNDNRQHALRALGEYVPKVKSVIVVSICEDNDTKHAKHCELNSRKVYQWSNLTFLEHHMSYVKVESETGKSGTYAPQIHTCSEHTQRIIRRLVKGENSEETHLRRNELPGNSNKNNIGDRNFEDLELNDEAHVSNPKKDEKSVYTIRIHDISRQAPDLLKSIKQLGFSKIKWWTLKENAGGGIDRLIVFQTGSMNDIRQKDAIFGIRHQVPKAESIIVVSICKDNDKTHAQYCELNRREIFHWENNTFLEHHISYVKVESDGSNKGKSVKYAPQILACSKDTHKIIERLVKGEQAIEVDFRTQMNQSAIKVNESATHKATSKRDWYDLEKAIKNFEGLKLEDDKDLSNAKYIKLKTGLQLAINRRNRYELAKLIQETTTSIFVGKLQSLLSEAQTLLLVLRKLSEYASQLLSQINVKPLAVLRRRNGPYEIIHGVMVATFMLLERGPNILQILRQELDRLLKPRDTSVDLSSGTNPAAPQQHDQSWTAIQQTFGDRLYLQRKIRTFDGKNVVKETYEDVLKILEMHTVDEVRKISVVAAAFHDWAYQVSKSMLRIYPSSK